MRADRGLKNVKESTQLGVHVFSSTFNLAIDLLPSVLHIFPTAVLSSLEGKVKNS